MNWVYTTFAFNMITGEILKNEGYWYDGPTDKACGASRQQKEAYDTQKNVTNQLVQQGQQIFGSASGVFNNLVSAFTPVVAAGINQEGFSLPEKSALESQAITQSGQGYRNASAAVKSAQAAVGGGNEYLPGGAKIGQDIALANSAAENTSNQLLGIAEKSKEVGRQNFFTASQGLQNAPGVFNTATNAGSAETSAAGAQAQTANEISQANNSWISSVTGALGGMASSAIGLAG